MKEQLKQGKMAQQILLDMLNGVKDIYPERLKQAGLKMKETPKDSLTNNWSL